MNLVVRASLVPVLLSLAACAANGYCKGEQSYQKAESVPALKEADGLKLPESAAALKIPPQPAKRVAYGETVKDASGSEEVVCLDKPPAMAPVAIPPPPAAPAAVPAPAASPAVAPAPGEPAEKPKG